MPSRVPASSSGSFALPVAAPVQLDLRLILALASVYVIWGSTYYAMRVAVAGLPPLLMGAARFTVAGAIMIAVDRARGGAWPSARHWLMTVPVGVLFFVGGNGLVAIALESLDSGVAAVVCATMPLWTAVIASATGERSSGREWLGLLIGFAGVAVLLGGASLDGDPLHVAFLVLSPLAWACGSILSRRLRVPGGLSVSGMQMATGGVALAAVAMLHGERPTLDAPAEAWLALLYLTVFGSLIAFTAFTWLLRNTRPALATSYAYVNPAIAVLLGAVLGGEVLGPTTIIATGLIVGAVALVVRASRR
jgi:drug/metabolite transporter (DMT)-like permease